MVINGLPRCRFTVFGYLSFNYTGYAGLLQNKLRTHGALPEKVDPNCEIYYN